MENKIKLKYPIRVSDGENRGIVIYKKVIPNKNIEVFIL
jgi:hypothetical protein